MNSIVKYTLFGVLLLGIILYLSRCGIGNFKLFGDRKTKRELNDCKDRISILRDSIELQGLIIANTKEIQADTGYTTGYGAEPKTEIVYRPIPIRYTDTIHNVKIDTIIMQPLNRLRDSVVLNQIKVTYQLDCTGDFVGNPKIGVQQQDARVLPTIVERKVLKDWKWKISGGVATHYAQDVTIGPRLEVEHKFKNNLSGQVGYTQNVIGEKPAIDASLNFVVSF